MRRLVLQWIILACWNCDVFAEEETAFPIRLPTNVVPAHYDLRLFPDLRDFTINGSVVISLNVTQNTLNITLHATQIEIAPGSITVTNAADESPIGVKNHQITTQNDFLTINLETELEKGSFYKLHIDFISILNDKLYGFYRSSYNEGDEKRLLATTQFEPTYARHAFPCFDEPALKATFSVTIGRHKDMTAISNMPRVKEEQMLDKPDYFWVSFSESVPMSTYLLAFVVSDFEHKVAPSTENGVEFRLWARRDAVRQIDYALGIGPSILQYFEDFFDVKYPLPKQDMIAIPDFSAGAMENWGLITYRETALLYSPQSPLSSKQYVAMVVSHELAHQWFGNLVSPSWWTDLWLNEGFASFVEYLGVEAVEPEMHLMNKFVTTEIHTSMRLDALSNSHPISVEVHNPDQISSIFDAISYKKGASIIRMMYHFLTEDTFRTALKNYLTNLAYDSATQDDLWFHLTSQGHLDETLPLEFSIKEIMDTWTLQTGYPVVNIKREGNVFTLNQERFLLGETDDAWPEKWWIPITFKTIRNNRQLAQNRIEWMKPENPELKITVDGLRDKDLLLFNIEQMGYFRVNYDESGWKQVSTQLSNQHESIAVTNRAQILDDVFNLARAGRINYSIVFDAARYLVRESQSVPWTAANRGLSYIKRMLERTPAYGDLRRYMQNLLRPLFRHIDFELRSYTSSLNDVELATDATAVACEFGLKECRVIVKASFGEWMAKEDPDNEESNPIDVNLKRVVYCSAVREGGEREWDFAWNRYKNANVAAEKSRLLGALACTREIWLLSRFLSMTLDCESGIRKQDVSRVIANVASNIYGRDLAFDFVRQKWAELKEYLGPKSISRVFRGNVLANRNTQLELDELLAFQESHQADFGSGERAVAQAVESARINLKWMHKNFHQVWDIVKEENGKAAVPNDFD